MTLTKSLSEMQKLLQYCNKKMRKHGRYDDIEDAARARKVAEAELFEPILKKYEKTLKSTATNNDKP